MSICCRLAIADDLRAGTPEPATPQVELLPSRQLSKWLSHLGWQRFGNHLVELFQQFRGTSYRQLVGSNRLIELGH
jgi:hypothetical protein